MTTKDTQLAHLNHLHNTVAFHARSVAADLSQVETISGFHLEITVKGRVDGELLVEYSLNDEYGSYGKEVKGDSLDAVLKEFKRRHGWTLEHRPLKIAAA